MTSGTDWAAQGVRNSWVLLAAQSINGATPVLAVSLGGLAGAHLLGDDQSLATLPVAGFTVGAAAGALPAALLMHRIGRRAGLIWGEVLAIVAVLAAATAIWAESFWFFVAALAAAGFSGAFVQQYRFAAAEAVPAELRPIAISRVMIGGIVTAVAAPPVFLATRNLFDPVPFVGAFVTMAVAACVGIGVLGLLRFPPRPRRGEPSPETGGRAFAEIARQPRFLIALLCATASFALMSFVMTAAPLAMVDHQHSEADALLGIQWHVIAMFAPSLVTGRLIARFGTETIVAVGLVLLIISAVVGLAGLELLHFWGMLILLGVGWNFAFVGATTMLTGTYTEAERGRVEGINDLIVFSTVALASLSSGAVLSQSGWVTINVIVLPVVGIVLVTLLGFVLRARQATH